MKGRFHGISSLALAAVAIIIGFAFIARQTISWGLFYLLLVLLSVPVIIHSYCAKCPCRLSCGHILPGKLTQILPKRQEGLYSAGDLAGAGLPIIFIILFPQYWLWQDKIILAVFWFLMILALVEIRICVCTKCTNKFCPGYIIKN